MNRPARALRRLSLLLATAPLVGCGSGEESGPSKDRAFPGETVTVAAVGDPASLTAVRSWRSGWERDTGAKVAFVDSPAEPGDLKGADVVIFPADRAGDLVDAKAIAPLLDATVRPPVPLGSQALPPDPLAYSDIAPAFREQVSKYGDDRVGLPIGASGLVVVYRRDAFESEANRAAAKEKGVTLAVPKTWTWDDLDALIRFFHGRDWDGDGQAESGVSAALGDDPEGVADALVLARAAALGQHPDHYAFLFDTETMDARVATPPFVEAMRAVASWKGLAPPGAEGFDAAKARAAFRAGEAAILIDLAERASTWTDLKKPSPVGVAPLPGSARVFDPAGGAWQDVPGLNRVVYLPGGGGWLAGLSEKTLGPRRQAAFDFLRALAGPEASRSLVADPARPMLPVRNAQLGAGLPDPRSALGVDPSAWGTAVARTVTAPRIVPGVRIPEAAGYLADFSAGRKAALAGDGSAASVEEALKGVAVAWGVRTERLGRARQLWHYRRSLNKLVTDAQPPAR